MKIITGQDTITETINEKINYIEKNFHSFSERRKQINQFFSEFYGNPENYTYEQLIIRRAHIKECEENAGNIFTSYFRATYISFLTVLLSSLLWSIYYLIKEQLSQDDLQNISYQLSEVWVQIITFLLLIVIICILSFVSVLSGRKYRKYHTIQLEMNIIDKIIDNRFKDSNLIASILENINQNHIFSDTAGD